ncbi:glycosyltransferase family 32 protein [Streptomonospora litoralis]|uniref:glycosyltransferase family 32 protein n=1 Tax=Streptomonospora litoralis TaxID=2498135 RepID=UPI001036C693|nr:glycosyltransferase [Streptomonospora litoralis]
MLHRIWLDDPMPARYREYGRWWDRLHPGWDRTDWTSSAELPPLAHQALVDNAAERYPRDWKRFQADVVRLELLLLYGGVYSDTDVAPMANLEGLLADRSCVLVTSPQHTEGDHPITNCLMAAAPGHPYIRALVDGIRAALEAHGHRHLAQSVGPWHLTRTYRGRDWGDEVTVVGHEEAFGPHARGGWIKHDWNTAARKAGRGVW